MAKPRSETPSRPVPEGLVLLVAPADVGGAFCHGKTYEVEDGMVLVPPEAVEVLKEHGFRPAE